MHCSTALKLVSLQWYVLAKEIRDCLTYFLLNKWPFFPWILLLLTPLRINPSISKNCPVKPFMQSITKWFRISPSPRNYRLHLIQEYQVIIDGTTYTPPVESFDSFKIIESGLYMLFLAPSISLQVRYLPVDLHYFKVEVPKVIYYNSTEGLCGKYSKLVL